MSKWPEKREGIEGIVFEIDGLTVDFAIDRFEPFKEWEYAKWCDIWFEIDDGKEKEVIGGEEICADEVVYIRDFIKDVLDGKGSDNDFNTIEPYYTVRKSSEEPCAMEWTIHHYSDKERVLVFHRNELEKLYAYLDKVIMKNLGKRRKLPSANTELIEAVENENFDENKVREMLKELSDIDALVLMGSYPTTYMNEAVSNRNLRMVKLLFEYGSDPNFLWEDSDYSVCPFSEMTMGGIIGGVKTEEDKEWVEKELAIARLFLEQGADAELTVEGESIMDIAIDRSIECEDDGYSVRFYRLLKEFHPGILWRVILPEREYEEIRNINELVQLFMDMAVGHRIERILYEMEWSSKRWSDLYYKYGIDDNNHDSDRTLGPRVLLLLDNGIIDLKYEHGRYQKRVFSLSEVSKDLLGLLGDDVFYHTPVWNMYYETKGPLASMIASSPIESVSKVGNALPEVSFRIGGNATLSLYKNSSDDFYFIVCAT